MRLASLDSLPPVSFPEVYRYREVSEIDRGMLLTVLSSAFPEFEWDDQKLDKEILRFPHVFGSYLLEQDSEPAGVVSGIIWPAEPSEGYIHWLGVHPAHVGHKLGYLISLALLHEFAQRGLKSAILDTDDFRLPAIATYLKLGFEPLIVEEGQEERWMAVRESMDASLGSSI